MLGSYSKLGILSCGIFGKGGKTAGMFGNEESGGSVVWRRCQAPWLMQMLTIDKTIDHEESCEEVVLLRLKELLLWWGIRITWMEFQF